MNALTIFYDPGCGLCTVFRGWLEAQPKRVRVEFLDFRSEEATRRFPGLKEMRADQDVLVLADNGDWWQGTGAWLTCLWTTMGYQPWAFRLAAPALQPFVKKAIHLISSHRLTLSRLMKLAADNDLEAELNAALSTECAGDTCNL